MDILFFLNGEIVIIQVRLMDMLFDWLCEECGLIGIKEGCNEGDCGVCIVIVIEDSVIGFCVLNVCILFMLQINGKVICIVEGLVDRGVLYLV